MTTRRDSAGVTVDGMSDDLFGEINEIRRTFTGGGLTGEVEFGHTDVNGKMTTFRVRLSNGREGWGRYSGPKTVRVRLKVERDRYGRRKR